MKLDRFCYCLLLFALSTHSLSAQYSPYFQNYSLSEYNAGNQNWDVSKGENGKLYVANNNGLLEYDGLKWDFNELPNKTTIRSVLAHDKRIYTGSYEEFGYWKKDTKGDLSYTSLSQSIKSEISLNEEFWQILAYKGTIIFRSFLNIYVYYPNGKIKKIEPKSAIISCSIVKDELYVSTLKNGIYGLEGDNLVQKIKHNILEDTKVISISEYRDQLLITTSLKGCFLYDYKNFTSALFEVNDQIRQHQLNNFSKLNDGRMVFGTIKNGVYLTDKLGNVLFHINKENGLSNNTVLSQYLDNKQKLWLGLDNGMASVNLDSHNYFFNDVSGNLGAVYDVIKHNGVTYIGSNTGLFYLDEKNVLKFIKGSQGQVWDLMEINGDLLCGHNDGTFLVENKQLKLISDYTGGWTIKKIPESINTYMQGTYTGFVRLKKENNDWKARHIGQTTMPIRFLVFEDQNTAWAAHAYKGLYKVRFDDNYDSIVSIENYENKGIHSNYNVRVYKIKNDICFKTNNGWQKYEPLIDSIVPYDFLNKSLGKDSYIISEDDIDQIVLKNSNDVLSFKSFENGKRSLSLTNNLFKNRLIVGYENISRINDSTYALNLNDGFMLIDGKSHTETALFEPQIESIEIDRQPINLDSSDIVEFKFNESLAIKVSSPKSENHFFEYSFSNPDFTSWHKLDNHRLELSNLPNKEYTIALRTSNDLGDVSSISKLRINILPPWYKDVAGFVLYGFLILSTILIMYILHKRKINKEQKALQTKFKREQQEFLKEKTLDNEKRIVQLKNESLKNEVKLKSKQLANTAMALVKKNETLLEIKNELNQNKNNFDNHYSYKKLLKKVDNSIAHKDEWEVFEYNFNQVHEEFFSGLKKQHISLSQKDLKICAYIKMNLSTKEIAPLMNISARGVETHRYRLKKKLDLENDISLTSYLLNFE